MQLSSAQFQDKDRGRSRSSSPLNRGRPLRRSRLQSRERRFPAAPVAWRRIRRPGLEHRGEVAREALTYRTPKGNRVTGRDSGAPIIVINKTLDHLVNVIQRVHDRLRSFTKKILESAVRFGKLGELGVDIVSRYCPG